MSAEIPDIPKNDGTNKPEKSPQYLESKRKFEELGYLGVTAQDHINIGSTFPPQLLVDNPGRTWGELLSDEEILSILENDARFKHYFRNDEVDRLFEKDGDEMANDVLKGFRKETPVDAKYLDSIGRLPEKYRHLLEE